ncbi:MAG TPA: aryl-sulfate sulfotransferase, partial [Candidatus Thermoplasmatota archaeon]|nr:aryl-sulfate sulfotransferase [Candidatus Thermoplasmatota archaeon]
MKQYTKSLVLILLTLLLLIGSSFTQLSSSTPISSIPEQTGRTIDGKILFAPFYSTTTYLINRDGSVNHTWPSSYQPFTSAYWMGNGMILRPICLSSGGGVQKINWDGSLAWDYRYTASGCTCHHDIKYLPNGNVLMIVWVLKTRTEAIAAGRNPNKISGNTFYPDKIIEVNQTGLTSGNVVWEWAVWDHLIQDYDASKNNYGVVGDHPELIDINFGDTFDFDWLHTNSLDYNSTYDQILISVHDFDEIWVIDHNTTTQEAAGHTGGHYGHGGDLLYRWGNPQAYRRGTSSDQMLFGQHDATWIPSGYPGAGDILFFNNGYNRPGTPKYSTVDEFTPPINSTGGYPLENGSAYGPENFTWDYTANPPSSFYSNVFSSAERLMDNDTLICSGIPGKFFEVTPDGTTVWQYTNPYPQNQNKWVFKVEFIPPA